MISDADIEERVFASARGMCEIAPTEITRDSRLTDDLGFDNLATVEFVMALEDEFGVEILYVDGEALQTLGDVVVLIRCLLASDRGPATPVTSRAHSVRCTICDWRGQRIHPQPKRCPACGATVMSR